MFACPINWTSKWRVNIWRAQNTAILANHNVRGKVEPALWGSLITLIPWGAVWVRRCFLAKVILRWLDAFSSWSRVLESVLLFFWYIHLASRANFPCPPSFHKSRPKWEAQTTFRSWKQLGTPASTQERTRQHVKPQRTKSDKRESHVYRTLSVSETNKDE